MENIRFDKSELIRSDLEYEGKNFNDINFEVHFKKKLREKLISLLQGDEEEKLSPRKFVLDCKHNVIKVMHQDSEDHKSDLKEDENLVDGLMSSVTKSSKLLDSNPNLKT